MPEQGIPTKSSIDGSVLKAAEGIFDLIDDDGLAAVGIDGGDEGIGIPSAERARRKPAEAEGTDDESDEADDFDSEAADALQGDEPEGEDAEEEPEEEAEEESEDEADEAPAEDEDPLVTVKVDGEERQVPLSEALRGYSSTASFTRKTQALAEERKAFESQRAEVQQERQRLDAYLAQAEELMKANMPEEPSPNNPQAWIRYQQEMQRLQRVQQERAALHEKMMEEQAQKDAEFIAQENEKLTELVPEWKDETVARAAKADLAKYAIGVLGFDEEDVRTIKDHRIVMLLRKAYAYDQIENKAQGVKQKVKNTKTLKPGKPSRRPAGATKSAKKMRSKAKTLRETGRVQDAAALFEDMLDDL